MVALELNHAPPPRSAQPQVRRTRSHQDVFSLFFLLAHSPFASLLLGDRSGAIRVWAQLGLRAPRGCRGSDLLKI